MPRKISVLKKLSLAVSLTAAFFGLTAYIMTHHIFHLAMVLLWLLTSLVIYKTET